MAHMLEQHSANPSFQYVVFTKQPVRNNYVGLKEFCHKRFELKVTGNGGETVATPPRPVPRLERYLDGDYL